jgi:hypothetical protein
VSDAHFLQRPGQDGRKATEFTMVQLTLPKNSTIRTGKTWPKTEGATNIRKFSIYRWNPDDGENPRVDP